MTRPSISRQQAIRRLGRMAQSAGRFQRRAISAKHAALRDGDLGRANEARITAEHLGDAVSNLLLAAKRVRMGLTPREPLSASRQSLLETGVRETLIGTDVRRSLLRDVDRIEDELAGV